MWLWGRRGLSQKKKRNSHQSLLTVMASDLVLDSPAAESSRYQLHPKLWMALGVAYIVTGRPPCAAARRHPPPLLTCLCRADLQASLSCAWRPSGASTSA